MAGWSQAENDFVRQHWGAGETAVQVADGLEKAFGKERTRDAVIGRIRILGLIRRNRPDYVHKGPRQPVRRPPTIWDEPGVLDRLETLWSEGVSTRKIAEKLSAEFKMPLTGNAVVGKAHRQGLAKKYPREINASDTKEARRVRGILIAREAAAKRERKRMMRAEAAKPILADVSYARPWQERGPRQCAFPLGERYAVMSCCFPTEETYCAAHRQAMGGMRKPWVNKDFGKSMRAA